MVADCPDCGGPADRTRPATRASGLPIRLRINGGTAPLSTFVCSDCGRVRFTTNVGPGSESCLLCDGPAAVGRIRTPSEELRLTVGETRQRLAATACADCGAVELRTSPVSGSSGTSCPVCRRAMVRATPAVGTEPITFTRTEKDDYGADPIGPVDPVAWACTGCGLVLVYDPGRIKDRAVSTG